MPRFGEDHPRGVTEVAVPVEVERPDLLHADAVDGADEVLVGDRVRALLHVPEVPRLAGGGRRDEHDLRAGHPERPCSFREVPVVTDVHPDGGVLGGEDRVPEVAGLEVVLLVEEVAVRDVVLAVPAEVRCRRRRSRRRCCSRRRRPPRTAARRARRRAGPPVPSSSARSVPSAAGSARSNHSFDSTWQKYGPVASSWRQTICAPASAACSTSSAWWATIVVRGKTPVVWMRAARTVLEVTVDQLSVAITP